MPTPSLYLQSELDLSMLPVMSNKLTAAVNKKYKTKEVVSICQFATRQKPKYVLHNEKAKKKKMNGITCHEADGDF